eukprot:TRINITY_DN46940_c0_g1_i1.p1 TRINITY_DN46940_c0_g1~~TRINITY_DN46940_c0_g1_i1.p1  ORF type:complete len:467 (+),score=124.30 TRINITY_DN46940_c0_g1_i1:61-1461(+)
MQLAGGRKMMEEELPTHEWQRARAAYSKVLGDKRWVTSNFELQNICAELGLQPSLEEIERAIAANNSNMDFEGLLRFVRYMKVKFHTPDPVDMDTVLCFVAVGGSLDKTGEVEAETLKQTCRRFDLAIDIDRLIDERSAPEIDSGRNTLNFREFEEIFDDGQSPTAKSEGAPTSAEQSVAGDLEDDGLGEVSLAAAESAQIPRPPPRLNLGYDFQKLLAREMGERGLPMPRPRRATDLLSPSHRSVRRSQPAVVPVKPAGEPPAKRTARAAQVTSNGVRSHAELRAKGVPAALYGGIDQGADDSDGAPDKMEKSSAKSPGRKRRQPSTPPQRGTLNKSSPQAILGHQTRIVGRTGLFVDDPPKLYPQHMAASSVPQLPQLDGAASPRGRGKAPVQAAEKSRIIQSIERRIEELSKRKVGSKYRNVSSRWNEGTLSARSTTRPPNSSDSQRPAPPGTRPGERMVQSR